jgi:hypothetical protein
MKETGRDLTRVFDAVPQENHSEMAYCRCSGCGPTSSVLFAGIVAGTSVFLASKPGTFHPVQLKRR